MKIEGLEVYMFHRLSKEVVAASQLQRKQKEIIKHLSNITIAGYPYPGPRSLKDYLKNVAATSKTLVAHSQAWISKSGINEKSALGREHKFLLDILQDALEFDQLNGSNLASLEGIARRLISIETAVRRNPKAPDFTGLDILLKRREDSTGSIHVPELDSWLSNQQKEQAIIMKQNRLHNEEEEQKEKAAKGKGGKEET